MLGLRLNSRELGIFWWGYGTLEVTRHDDMEYDFRGQIFS